MQKTKPNTMNEIQEQEMVKTSREVVACEKTISALKTLEVKALQKRQRLAELMRSNEIKSINIDGYRITAGETSIEVRPLTEADAAELLQI